MDTSWGIRVSENESFIDEVTEEVRRDKLYLFLRKYGWIPVIIIIAIILGTVIMELRSNTKQVRSEKLGDFLVQYLDKGMEDTSGMSQDLSNFVDLKPLVRLMLEAKVLENNSESKMAMIAYEEILKIEDIPTSLRDFVKFKLLLLVKDDNIRVEKLLVELINPDSAFNLLALEQRVLFNINENNWKEAISNLNLLIADPEATQALVSRATQIKKAIKLDSLSDK